MLDGIKVGNMQSNAGRTGYTLSPLLFDQVDVVVSGTWGIPHARRADERDSAVRRKHVLGHGPGERLAPRLQSDNLTERLSAPRPTSGASPWGVTDISAMKAPTT